MNTGLGFSVVMFSFSDEVMFFSTAVPQESGQLPVSRLGDAMRSAGMNPTASEVGEFRPAFFPPLENGKKIFLKIFWVRKTENY